MEKNNMTAVEWIIKQMEENFLICIKGSQEPKDSIIIYNRIIEQAKQMEKEQIMDAWIGTNTCDSAEQYYNKTYGKNTEKTQP